MPPLVRTPEDVLKAEKKDLYILRSSETEQRNAPGLVMIQGWIKEYLPGTRMESLGPSEHSGMIIGGIGRDVWVNFSAEGLATFCAYWEKDDQSVDPRFQCYQEHGRFMPTRDKTSRVGITQWRYTPLGFIHHTLSDEDSQGVGTHPASVHDILHAAKAIWPELEGIATSAMTHGSIFFCQRPTEKAGHISASQQRLQPHLAAVCGSNPRLVWPAARL